ncbi:MAG: putative iron-regulated protein [Oleispira sp.]|jgi:putative iron-regulated protein
MKLLKLAACITSASLLIACGGGGGGSSSSSATAINIEKAQLVLNTNADIALATYTDSVETAKTLKAALITFKNDSTEENLTAAKTAWLVAREPYGQTEVYRFRNSPVDSLDVEGDLNAWPLGEALIDYVNTGNDGDDFDNDQIGVTEHGFGDDITAVIDVTNASSQAGNTNTIIGNTDIVIDDALLAKGLAAEDEHDVISGYHAIEFLLWGQDLNNNGQTTAKVDREEAVKTEAVKTATNPINTFATGGQRPLTDFTTDTNADRRHAYLEVVVNKLIADLELVQAEWTKGSTTNYRAKFTTITNDTDAKQKLTEILTGMGTLSEGELAGERMQIAFSSNSQEDEHSCFSDNTHRDIWLNAEGVSNSFYGSYAGYDSTLDGTDNETTNAIDGYGIDEYLTEVGLAGIAVETTSALVLTEINYNLIDASARNGAPFDVLIMSATEENPVAKTIKSLNAQSRLIQDAANQLGLGTVVEEDASDCNTENPTTGC